MNTPNPCEVPGADSVSGTSATASPIVCAADAAFSYGGGVIALDHINFAIAPGEALALVGPNGSGKSTLLKALLGLVSTVDGEVRVLDAAPRRAASHVGYLPQHDEIDLEFPVSLRQVVMMGRFRHLGPFKWPGKEDRQAVTDALTRVDLDEHANDHFGALSGGQRQRGLLARALVDKPALLLLDEPFNGLDTTSRRSLMATLRRLRDEGVAIIVSTHDLELAHQVCSHILLVNKTQVAFGPIHETLTPEHVSEAFGESHDHLDTHSDLVAHPHPVATNRSSGDLL